MGRSSDLISASRGQLQSPPDLGDPITSPDPSTWVDEYGDYLFAYAVARVRDRTTAEDLVQETFLAALKSRGSFQGNSSFPTWLVGILKRKIFDHFRRLAKRPGEESTESYEKEALFLNDGEWKDHWDPAVGPRDWAEHADKAYERKEFMTVIDHCLKRLPERLAAAFSMREIDDLETSEICKILDISATNLWVMLHRSRMQLRRCIELRWLDRKTEPRVR